GVLDTGPTTGPFWLSPDGTVAVFGSGQVVRVSYPDGLAPKPARPPRPAAARPPRPPVAPAPREVELEVSPEGVAIAPRPRPRLSLPAVPRLPGYAGGPVAAPTDFEGLKFYLACDESHAGRLRESVSGRSVGRAYRAELVDGVRGKA